MPKRTQEGNPLWGQPHLRAADAIALLSGVNYSSVEKVLCAIHLLEDELGYTMAGDLTKYKDVPLRAVNATNPGHRGAAAMELCLKIARDPKHIRNAEGVLNLANRFRGPGDVDHVNV